MDRRTLAGWLWQLRGHDTNGDGWTGYNFGYVNGWTYGTFSDDFRTMDQVDRIGGYLHRLHQRHAMAGLGCSS